MVRIGTGDGRKGKSRMRRTLLLLMAVLFLTVGSVRADEPDEPDEARRREYLKKLLSILPPTKSLYWEKWLEESGELPPNFDKLPSHPDLPDPLVFNDGTRVTTKEQWARRRDEIKEMVRHYFTGHMPPPPGKISATELSSQDIFDGKCTYRKVRLKFGPNDAIKMDVSLAIPKGQKGPFPAIINLSWGWLPRTGKREKVTIERGYVFCTFRRDDCDRDDWKDKTDGFEPHYPDYDWSTLAKWAWGVSRCVDYLSTLDFIDKDKIAVVGHSRNGKTALIAGAFDERIALCVPNNSGCDGTAPHRFIGDLTFGESIELLSRGGANHWQHPRLRFFCGREDKLPFDQHFLTALIAPRAYLTNDATHDRCGDAFAVQQGYLGAKKVYDFLGVPEKIGMRVRRGKHGMWSSDWRAILDWCDRHFRGDKDKGKFYDLLFPYSFQGWLKMSGEKKPAVKEFPVRKWKSPKTVREWGKRSAEIKKNVLWVLGEFPKEDEPGKVKSENLPKEWRYKLLSVDMGDGVVGHVYLPRGMEGKLPGVVFLHPYSHPTGYRETYPVAIEFYRMLVYSGHVVITFDQLGYGKRFGKDGPTFYEKHPKWSQLGKMVADTRRAVDVLASLEFVDKDRIGVVGFSLGGKVALHAAALDERIKAAVSVCGFSPLRTEKRGLDCIGVRSYSILRGLAPRMGFFIGHEERLPYDYDELLALIAPRRVLVVAPEFDRLADLAQVKRCTQRARQVYELLGAEEKLELQTPYDYHRFGPARREEAIRWLNGALKQK